MDSRARLESRNRSTVGLRVYEDFEPRFEWKRDVEFGLIDILAFYLPEFRKEHLRVQLGSKGNINVSGERPLLPLSDNKWSRFRRDLQLPENCNANEVTAKFDDGVLSVIIPKRAMELKPKPEDAPINKNGAGEQKKSDDGKSVPPNGAVEGTPRTLDNEKKDDGGGNVKKVDAEQKKLDDESNIGSKNVVEETSKTLDKERKDDDTKKTDKLTGTKTETSIVDGGWRFSEKFRYGSQSMRFRVKRPRKTIAIIMVAVILLMGLGFYLNQRIGKSEETFGSNESV